MLFDKAIVIAKGETLFNGPVEELQEYFENQGFQNGTGPDEKSLPVWLEDLIQKPKLYARPEKQQDASNRSLWIEMARYHKTSKLNTDLHMELMREMTMDVFDYDDANSQHSRPHKKIMHVTRSQQDLGKLDAPAHARAPIKSFDYQGVAVDYSFAGVYWSLPVLPGWFRQVKELVKRRVVTCKRNKVLLWSRLFQVVVMGACLGL